MEQLYIAEKPAVAAALADFFSRHGNKFTKENGHFISIKRILSLLGQLDTF